MAEVSGYPRKTERLRIRCDRETFVEFKKLAAEIGDYEQTLKVLMELYRRTHRFGRLLPDVR